MFSYKRLNSKNNAKNALREILQNSNKADLRFVIYHLSENHVECASDEGGPSAVAKYNLSRETANAIHRDATNGFDHAALAYNLRTNEVFLLDAVPELAVASCLLLCVMNILVGVTDAYAPSHAFVGSQKVKEIARPNIEDYVAAAPRPKTKVVRDSNTGRFMRLEEDCDSFNEDEIIGRRFRLGHRA